MLILVDSGILLRLVERNDPQHAAIRVAVRALRSSGDELVTAAQNAAEFWNICTRPATARGGYSLSIADADRRLRVIERLFHVLPDSPASYQTWRGLLVAHTVKGVQVHDARLVALMRVYGNSHILTLNASDFARYPGIVPIDPSSLQSPPQFTVSRPITP
jgi:predicted nucleic acid-binding protein